MSVPEYNAYNHHYFGWLTGRDARLATRDPDSNVPNPTNTFFRSVPNTSHVYPTSIVFKENPGGEFRKSYHGYPSGYAQLLHSPTTWYVEPMQIDTHNRQTSITDLSGYNPTFLPKRVVNGMTDNVHSLSPLIECPCTTRITRRAVKTPVMMSTHESLCTDANVISDLASCVEAVKEIGVDISSSSTVNDATQPRGCSMIPTQDAASYQVIFNDDASSTSACGKVVANRNLLRTASTVDLAGLVQIDLSIDSKREANITMIGPSDVWFGVGFNAKAMSDLPYAITIDGKGSVTERKLENHGPGTVLKSSVTVLENSVSDGVRTVVMTRPTLSENYEFPTEAGVLNVITAIGSQSAFSYHKSRSGATITLVSAGNVTCVCEPSKKTYFSYMNQSTFEFDGYDCVDEPRSDMLRRGDGTGRNVSNAACDPQTYKGGLQCCKHQFFLTDAEQDSQIPEEEDVYFLKWRYYFQEYTPATETKEASHKHLHHMVFLIDDAINDYEEAQNPDHNNAIDHVGKIEAHITAMDLGLEDISGHMQDNGNIPMVPDNFTTITPLMLTPHCHAPSCIREELWNADTGEMICNTTATYGTGKGIFNESNYITINPCLFGYQPGLREPFHLSRDTNLTAVKYFNNTYRHLGQMAQWTGLMVYDTDPY